MNKSLIFFLFACFWAVYFSGSAAAVLALKKDQITQDVVLVGENGPEDDATGSAQEDHISRDQLPSGQRFEKYLNTVNNAVGDLRSGLYEPAAGKLMDAIALEPSMPYAYDNLANVYYHQQKYQEAMEMSEKALQVAPDYANAYGNLGNIYYALGKYKEAEKNYQKARDLFRKKKDAEGIERTDQFLRQPFL